MADRSLPKKLHLGCGLTTPEGWLNVDGSWNARLAKWPLLRSLLAAVRLVPRRQADIAWSRNVFFHDLRRPLPWADGTFQVVYSSHVLEHLHHADLVPLLRECRRVLEPGGVARMLVPDLRAIILEYMGQTRVPWDGPPPPSPTAADRVNTLMLLRSVERPRGGLMYRVYSAFADLHSHKWMYDGESLAHHMRAAGFIDVAERPLHDSRIPGVEAVESPTRVLDGRGVCVEGVKPA